MEIFEEKIGEKLGNIGLYTNAKINILVKLQWMRLITY